MPGDTASNNAATDNRYVQNNFFRIEPELRDTGMPQPALTEVLGLGVIDHGHRNCGYFFTGLAAISSSCSQPTEHNLNLPIDDAPADRLILGSKFLMHT